MGRPPGGVRMEAWGYPPPRTAARRDLGRRVWGPQPTAASKGWLETMLPERGSHGTLGRRRARTRIQTKVRQQRPDPEVKVAEQSSPPPPAPPRAKAEAGAEAEAAAGERWAARGSGKRRPFGGTFPECWPGAQGSQARGLGEDLLAFSPPLSRPGACIGGSGR